jgi:signal peptide peptidase SppA
VRSYILQAFTETPWAILPSKLAVLEEIVYRHVNGEKLNAEEVQERIHGAARPADHNMVSTGSPKMVAILPLFGTIFPRANMMTDVSGATSADRFGAKFSDLVNNPDIGAIVLDINSPGGQVNGIAEAANRIFEARGKKPVVAVANHLMASAAYWIGSAADEIVATPDADMGSVGVFAVHQDVSRKLEQDGVKVTFIKEGKYKTEGNPYEPLSDEARAVIQEHVSDAYDKFINALARNRGVKPDDVRNGYGEGRVVSAQHAVRLGMADRIETLDQTVERLFNQMNSGSIPASSGRSAEQINLTPTADSSDPIMAEKERQAQSLRDRVNKILNKEK